MAVKPDDARFTRTGGLTAGHAAARPSPREDARLVEALRAGAPGAFAQLVADYQAAIFNLALRLVRDREDARDITQDVFIKAHDGIPRSRGELHLWAWLYRVTVNSCWDHLRAARRRPLPAGDAEELAAARPDDEVERAEVARLFSQSLAALPPRQQAALLLKDVHGLGHADIAEALGISKGSSKVLLFHARHSFRRAYRALVADETPAATCRVAERAAAASVGGRLSAAQRQEVLRHARTCAACRRVVDGWEGPRAVGLALALPMVAAPQLFAASGGTAGGLGPAATAAGLSAGASAGAAAPGLSATVAAGTATGAAAAPAVAGTGGAAAAGAALATTGTAGASLSAAGGLAAKLAGLGVVKAAAVVVAAGSLAYGGAEAATTSTVQPPLRAPAVSSVSAADQQAPRADAAAPASVSSRVLAVVRPGDAARARSAGELRDDTGARSRADGARARPKRHPRLRRHLETPLARLLDRLRDAHHSAVAGSRLRATIRDGLGAPPLQHLPAAPGSPGTGTGRSALAGAHRGSALGSRAETATTQTERPRRAVAAFGHTARRGAQAVSPASGRAEVRAAEAAAAHGARVVTAESDPHPTGASAAKEPRPCVAPSMKHARPDARPTGHSSPAHRVASPRSSQFTPGVPSSDT